LGGVGGALAVAATQGGSGRHAYIDDVAKHLNVIVVMPGRHTYTFLVEQPGRYLWFCTFRCDEWAMERPGYMSGYITVS